jgi:hydrogenase maturation protease
VAETLVLGLGNILLGDEGVGVRVIERLLELYDLPKGVQVMDGGTLGLDLLPYLEEASRLLLVASFTFGDETWTDKPHGALLRLAGDEISAFLEAAKVPPQQQGLQDLLTVAKLKEYLPDTVVLWGIQVESSRVSLELSPSVIAQVDALTEKVLDELALWGIHLRRRTGW